MPANLVERLLVNIEANAAQLQAELAKGGASVQAFGKKTNEIAKGADGIGQRYSAAAVQVASAAENMARAGKIGGDGLKQIVVQGSNMAFLFGPGGAVVGAIGVASLAILEIFRKTRDEVAKTSAETKQAIADLQNAGDVAGLTARARLLFQGTPANGFKDGIKSLRKELAALGKEIDDSPLARLNSDGSISDPLGTISEKTRERYNEVSATLKKLEAEFVAVRGAILGAGPPSERDVLPIATTVKSLESSAKEAAKVGTVLRDLQQGYADLIAESQRGDITLETFDRRVRELADAFADKLEKPSKATIANFKQLQQAAAAAREALAKIAAAKAALEFDALRASLTPGLVDDFRVSLRQLGEELEKRKLSPTQIADLTALKQAQLDVLEGAEDLESRIKSITARAISSFDAQLGLMDALRGAKEQLRLARTAPDALTDAAEIRIQGLLKQIETLEAKIKELGGSTESALNVGNADRFADALSDASDFALGLSTVLLGADDTITRMIAGVSQVASGFAKVAELASKAGGLSELFSSGAGVASALPGIGAIVGGLGALAGQFGKEDPATRALREALDRNARRLEELTSSVGELVQISVSGADAAAVRGLRLTSTEPIDTNPVSGEPIFGEVPLSSQALVKALQQAGVSLKELQQIASDFGISFANADLPTVAEIEGLQKLIAANGLRRLNETLRGQLDLLEQQARIDPDAFAGIAGVIKRIAVLTGEQGVPALKTALDGISLDSVDGPAQAIERLKQLLADFTAGDIDLSQLGGLNPEAFAEAIASLIESIRNAAPALRTPATKFADAIEAFGVAVELGSLTAEQELAKAKDLFATLFPDLAASVDTSSGDSFKESIRGIIDGFAADGDLSDAERAQIEVLRALLGAFEGATPAATQLADALSVLADRFEIFGTSAAEQITAILEEVTGDASVGKNAGFALLKGLTDGLDLATEAGQADLRARAKAIFEQLSEGGITAEEQAVIETLKRLLGLAGDVADEAARAAAEALAEQERLSAARRRQQQGIVDGADTDIKLNDVTDPIEQLRIRVAALAKAFPAFGDVLADFDVSTQSGRDAMEAWIRSIAGSPEDLERLATAMGITVDELLASLLELESGADSAAVKVATLAERLGAAFDEADFTAELEGISDPLERLKRTAGSVSVVLPEVAEIFKQFSLDTAQGRAGAEAALIALGKSTSDAAVRSAVLKLLSQIRGVPQPSATLGDVAGSTASSGGRANVQAAATITEVTANRMVDLLQRSVAAEEAIRDTIRASLSRSLAVPAPIVPPALPSLLAGGLAAALAGSAGGSAGGITLQVTLAPVFSGTINTGDPDELSRLVQRRMLEIVQGELATELLVALRRAGVARAT